MEAKGENRGYGRTIQFLYQDSLDLTSEFLHGHETIRRSRKVFDYVIGTHRRGFSDRVRPPSLRKNGL